MICANVITVYASTYAGRNMLEYYSEAVPGQTDILKERYKSLLCGTASQLRILYVVEVGGRKNCRRENGIYRG